MRATATLRMLILLCVAASSGYAADQTILGNKFSIRNPGLVYRRQIRGSAKEGPGSANTLVGNPAASGASLEVIANGGTPSDQTFSLPAIGWTATPVGYSATTITETGSAPGFCLRDGVPRQSSLVSIVCVPPTYNGIVDPSPELPGPGAISLPATLQFLP